MISPGKEGSDHPGLITLSELCALPREQAAAWGGKALGLARLFESGFVVPECLVMRASTLPPEDWSEAQRDAVLQNLRPLLEEGAVAVRSSALVEDGPDRSFAGLFSSTLEVRGSPALLSSLGVCVRSGGSERVRAYAATDEALPVGVVIQRMVDADCAGVCFTRDPAGEDSALLIEAVPGLGDALVSGSVQPERWRVYRNGLGNVEVIGPDESRLLNTERIEQIFEQGRRIEVALGQPMDLEWAFDQGGRLWWLQARPISALKEHRPYSVQRFMEGVREGPITVWSSWNVRETMPDAFLPLTWSLWRDRVLPLAIQQLTGIPKESNFIRQMLPVDLVQGRVIFNLNAMLGAPLIGPIALLALRSVEPETLRIIKDLRERGILVPRDLPRLPLSLLPPLVLSGARGLVQFLGAFLPGRAFARLERAASSLRSRPDPRGMGDQELLMEILLLDTPEGRTLASGLNLEAAVMLVWILADRAFAPWPRAGARLTAGVVGPTTRISLMIDELGKQARALKADLMPLRGIEDLRLELSNTAEGRDWLLGLDRLLDWCGQRGPKEFDLAAPRWEEDPTMLLELIQASSMRRDTESVGQRLKRVAIERDKAIEEALHEAPLWRRPLMRLLALAARELTPLREAPKHFFMVLFQRSRCALLELGSRLAARGLLARPEDIFFLEHGEIQRAFETPGGGAVSWLEIEARQERIRDHQARRAPDYLRSDGVPLGAAVAVDSKDGGSSTYKGIPVSGGLARGRVRVLHEPCVSGLSSADVLVVRFADPGWTPLFPIASALVMEVGGMMCHAAVVARELSIPAVFGLTGATSFLVEGELIEVDGLRGTVRCLERAPSHEIHCDHQED